MDRKKAREYAFVVLFQYKFQPEEVGDILADFFLKNDVKKQGEYIGDIVSGVVKKIDEIDSKIMEFSRGWNIDRIGAVSLAALRLGTYEMLYRDDVPAPVAVNEAVNLTREYAGDEAVSFVNGVLGSIQKQLEKTSDKKIAEDNPKNN